MTMIKLQKQLAGLLLITVIGSVQASPKKNGDYIVIKQTPTYLSYRQMALQLVNDYPNANPLVLTHARDLVAGKPVKIWKNCLLGDTLQAELERNSEVATQIALATNGGH